MEEERLTLEGGQYITLGRKLGEGSFGIVREGVLCPDQIRVAVKLEPVSKLTTGREREVLKHFQTSLGFPKFYASGVTERHRFLVTQLLGDSINDKFRLCDRVFSISTTLMLGVKMLDRLETMHRAKFVHRDVKPHNYTTSLHPGDAEIYIIDFGLAKRITDASSARSNQHIVGTLPFISINIHMGVQASERDDLESLLYVLVYFLRGYLPWYDPKGEKLTDLQIKERKMETTLQALCNQSPTEFIDLFKYVRGLHYGETPDYQVFRYNFLTAMRAHGGHFDWKYDWVNISQRRSSLLSPLLPALDLHTNNHVSYTQLLSSQGANDHTLHVSEQTGHRRLHSCLVAPSPNTSRNSSKHEKSTGSSVRSKKFSGLESLSSNLTLASKNKFSH